MIQEIISTKDQDDDTRFIEDRISQLFFKEKVLLRN